MKLLLELMGSIGNRFLRAAIMNDYHNSAGAAQRKAADIFSLVNDTNCSFVLVCVCVCLAALGSPVALCRVIFIHSKFNFNQSSEMSR